MSEKKEIVFASSNAHKIEEVSKMLGEMYRVLGLKDIGFDAEIEETGKTFEANAEVKAAEIYDFANKMCFADDSGLEVKALKGQPGVRSARFAGEPSNSEKNIDLLLEKLQGKTNREARFVTVICLMTKDKTLFFEGDVKGKIIESRRGSNGFGYDSVFVPDGYDKTFAEMGADEKNNISHRKMAMSKLMDFLPFV
jgi:XTP/dITP diphosphohydrolase